MSEVTVCPVEGCTLTVDVILKSSDGKLIGAHQRNLGIYTEGFPIAESTVASDPVSLEETADILELMLQYTHHTRQPILDDIPITLLASLAEAVEKYMLYSAMEVCRIHMKHSIDAHPATVFFYAAKHNYPAMVDKAAKLTLNNPGRVFLSDIRQAGLHDDIAFRWLRYRDRWMEVFADLLEFTPELHRRKTSDCLQWDPFQLNVIGRVRDDLTLLNYFSDIVNKSPNMPICSICQSHANAWVEQVKGEVERLPKYSEV